VTENRPQGRIDSLDGLRGLAALVVVVHHVMHANGSLDFATGLDGRAQGSWVVRTLTFTPLHIVWAGTEAVLVFFVLSGLVLAMPRSPVADRAGRRTTPPGCPASTFRPWHRWRSRG